MKRYSVAVLFAIASFATALQALTFVQQPQMTKLNDSTFQITFAVSENTDVEVAIVKLRDSTIVRHLAAGLLGANPPAPLIADNLAQTLVWNAKDDFGKTVAQPESLSVRVRAGMSPKLVNLAAEELYAFNQGTLSLVSDKDGSVFLLGKAGSCLATCATFLRKYDGAGNYLKTVYPPSADLPADSVTSYGINVLPGGGWAPKTTQISADKAISPRITNALLNNSDAQVLALTDKDEFLIVSGLQKQLISKSGASYSAAQTLLSGPPQVTGGTFDLPPFGPRYIALSANPKYLYLSGWYYGSIDHYYYLENADTSGFWGDGRVFKLDVATGIASPWIKLDSVPVSAADRAAKLGCGSGAGNFAAIHGITIDDSGHVFICDRLHKRVSVYDTSANLLGSIPCINPDLVAVSKRTGAVYVLRRGSGNMTLLKYPGWRDAPAQAASVLLTTSVSMTGRYEPATPSLGIAETENSTSVYVGYQSIGFRLYADNGSSFGLLKDFSQGIKGSLTFERLAVDRTSEKVYWTHNARDAVPNYAISNWSNPVPYLASTADNKPFYLDNITFAPNGMLYGSPAGLDGYPSFIVPVIRFTNDSCPAAAKYANTASNIITSGIGYEGGSIGLNHRGVAVGWQGQVAVFEEAAHLLMFPDTGYSDTNFKGTPLITVTNSRTDYRVLMNCVKFDPAGNYYVGILKRGPDAFTPAGFAADNAFLNQTGSVVKFAAGTTGTVTGMSYRQVESITGEAKIYPQPFGLFSGDNSSLCNCRNTYFDVDPYGRLFVPNAATSQVYVADNSGNNIMVFGEYGNTDARGPAIPIGWSTSVAASEDYVYITDAINSRIVRVQMTYVLDNIPGLTEHNAASENETEGLPVTAEASPNPFNPASTLRLNLPVAADVHIAVYRADGRFVRDIAAGRFGAGVRTFAWHADDNRGVAVASGLYVYRITTGKKIMFVRTMLLK